jgi:hypothetical protein
MSPMAIKGKALAAGVALLAASLTLILSYKILDWFLIRYWEWQHDGRRMAFTLWADFRAIPLAILTSLVVVFLTFRVVRRQSKFSRSTSLETWFMALSGIPGSMTVLFPSPSREE